MNGAIEPSGEYVRKTIGLSPHSQIVLQRAAQLWPEEDSVSGLIGRVLAEWNRQAPQLDRIEQSVAKVVTHLGL